MGPELTAQISTMQAMPGDLLLVRRGSFYRNSGKDHQLNDFNGIHQLICTQLIPLRNPDAILGSEEERAEQHIQLQKQRAELLRISQQQAYKFLFEGQFELAIPAALQSLRFSMKIYGNKSVELVPSYLILGEASIGTSIWLTAGLKKYREAEDYLSLAKWAILQSQSCNDTLMAKLHRNFGQLYAAQDLHDKALYQLALDVRDGGLSAVTGGYYQMGMIFQKKGRNDDASAFYDKVVSIWSNIWTPSLELGRRTRLTADVAQAAEATQMLNGIIKYRLHNHPTTVKGAHYTLAKVLHSAGQLEKAREMANRALEGKPRPLTVAYESALGREHSTTQEVKSFIKTTLNPVRK
ncbi:Zinc finger MYND domain-containing protein 12 [Kappamyces sp. JEL0680]|nr:Zinc finger MYND domain-containing protein 12 [Kappamyces sp. JEL0680]